MIKQLNSERSKRTTAESALAEQRKELEGLSSLAGRHEALRADLQAELQSAEERVSTLERQVEVTWAQLQITQDEAEDSSRRWWQRGEPPR